MRSIESRIRGGLLWGVLLAMLPLATAAADPPEPAVENNLMKSLQGTWTRQQQTPNGVVKIVKVHEGTTTLVTGYDPAGNVYYQHASEFSIDNTGKVDTLTFFNRKILAGPQQGTLIKEPTTFIVRIIGDQFFEVYGFLADDTQPPRVTVWEREKP